MSTGDHFGGTERGRFLDDQQVDPLASASGGSPRPPGRSGPPSSQLTVESRRINVMRTLYQRDRRHAHHFSHHSGGHLLDKPAGGSGHISFQSDATADGNSQDDSALPLFGSSPLQNSPANQGSRHHTYMYSMFNPNSNKPQAEIFKIFISVCILVSVASFIVDTMPHGDSFDLLFFCVEGVTSAIFGVEYVLRLYLITQNHHYSHPLWGRLRYACSIQAVIDLVSWMPFFLELVAQGMDGPFEHRGSSRVLPNLMVLKALRIFRILKTRRVAHAMGVLGRVLGHNREVMTVSVVLCGGLMLIQATMLYYFKPPASKNPDCTSSDFESIPATMYLSILMITTLRAPSDACDYPWYTKVLIATNAITSVAMLAIPTSMLTWGFEAEAERVAQKLERKEHLSTLDPWPRDRSQECDSSSSSSSSTSDDDSFAFHGGNNNNIRSSLVGGGLTPGFPSSSRVSLQGTLPQIDPSPKELVSGSQPVDLLKVLIEEVRSQRSEISKLRLEVAKLTTQSAVKKETDSMKSADKKDGSLMAF